MEWSRRRIAALTAIAATLVFAAVAAAGAGLGNGDFERGNLDNWSVASNGPGAWFVYSGKQAPPAGAPIDRPPQGTYAAVAGQFGPSQTALYRMLSLGTSKTQQISFYVYYRNECGTTFAPYQQEYRIEILNGGVDPLTNDPADTLRTLFVTKDGDPAAMKPTLERYVLSGLGGHVTLRFLASADCAPMTAATDAVKLQSAS